MRSGKKFLWHGRRRNCSSSTSHEGQMFTPLNHQLPAKQRPYRMKYLPSTDIFGIHHNPSGCCTIPTIVKLRLFGTHSHHTRVDDGERDDWAFPGLVSLRAQRHCAFRYLNAWPDGELACRGISQLLRVCGKRIIVYLSIMPLDVLFKPGFHNRQSSRNLNCQK